MRSELHSWRWQSAEARTPTPVAATTAREQRRARAPTVPGRPRLPISAAETANEVERGDEEGAWEVEVTKSSGETVDVHLDTSFKVLSVEGDSENEAGDTD